MDQRPAFRRAFLFDYPLQPERPERGRSRDVER
jgi:hypothetical protein